MATSYPTSIDALTNPTATDPVTNPNHASQHANANDAIEALEAKVGVNSSAVTTSHDYKLSGVTGSDKAMSKTGTETGTNKTFTAPTISDFTNMAHDHADADDGGQLTDAALSAAVTVPKGGTGVGTFTDGGVLLGNGTGAVQVSSAGTAGQIFTSNGAGVDGTFQDAPGVAVNIVAVATVTLSSADILAMHTTPKELLPTPGAGKINVVDEITFFLDYGTATYALGVSWNIRYAGDSVNLIEAVETALIRATADAVWIKRPVTTGGNNIIATAGINTAVQLITSAGTAYTTGDGTLKCFIKYRTITL